MNERELGDRKRYGAAFARRLAEWEAGGAALSDEEARQYIGGASADLVLISDYLDGVLDPGRRAEVEWRLGADEDFQNAVEPFLRADEALRAGAGGASGGSASLAVLEPAAVTSEALATGGEGVWPVGGMWRAMAFGMASVVAVALVALLVIWFRVLDTEHARRGAAELWSGRAVTSQLWVSATASTGPGEVHTMHVPQGTITAHENTRLTSGVDFGDIRRNATAMDGEVLVEVRKGTVFLRTATAEVALGRGAYLVRSVPGSGETRVVVYTGRALVRRVRGGAAMTSVGPGREVVVGLGGRKILDRGVVHMRTADSR